MRFFIILFCSLSTLYVSAQQDSYLKKLGIKDNGSSGRISMQTIDKLNKTTKDSVYSNAKKSEKYSRIAYKIASKIEYSDGQVEALINMSRAKIYLNQVDSAQRFAELALSIAQRSKSQEFIIKSHEMKGNVYSFKQNYDKAVDEYFIAVKMADKFDKSLSLTSYVNLGHVFKKIGNLPKSRFYSEKSYQLSKKYKDTSVAISALNHLGLIEKTEENYESALKHFEEGLDYARKTGDLKGQAEIMYNMSNVYFNMKMPDKGFELYNQSMEISKTNDTYSNTAIGFHSLALNCSEVGRDKEAWDAAEEALNYAMLSENFEIIMECYALKAHLASDNKKYKDAVNYLSHAYVYKDSMNLTELNNAILSAEDNYEEQKKAQTDSLDQIQKDLKISSANKLNEERLKSREIMLWISGIMLVIVSFGVYYLFKNNKLVKAKNIIVENQKGEIEKQHREITDSINYAQRIQEAIISNEDEWKKVSEDSFVLFKPKNVVSGDFYWAHNIASKNLAVWAVADCTGHGVPGAFMSMLGIGFLNEIVIEGNTVDPGEILTLLRTKIVGALTNKHNAQTKDGMDISLCIWDKNDNTLSYAGANNPLWLIRSVDKDLPADLKSTITENNLSLVEMAADKMPIGYQLAHPPPFMTKKFQLLNEDIIVLFSDGYADQFGGDQGKKLKYKTFKELLLRQHRDQFSKQGEMLDDAFENWRGTHEQIDDICVAGVKINI